MYQVRIFDRLKKGHRDCQIYTREEADALGITYRHWRECDVKGEYGLSDDGYVTELLDRAKYGTDIHGYWSFTGGIAKSYKNARKPVVGELLVGPLVSGERKAKKIEEAMKTSRAREIIRAYIINDKKIDLAVKQCLPAAPMVELNKWRTVAKSEVFKMAVKEEILSLLDSNGFSRQKTIMLLSEAIEMAREKKDVGNMMRAVENLFDILGFREKETHKESITHSAHTLEHLADSLIEHKDTVKLTREVEKDAE